jgi:pyruvate dehydrogenase E1 component
LLLDPGLRRNDKHKKQHGPDGAFHLGFFSKDYFMLSPSSSDTLSVSQAIEDKEWLESLDYVFHTEGPARVKELLRRLQIRAQVNGVVFQCPGNTPYVNTIPLEYQPPYPGDLDVERRIRSINQWNAMAMVVRANRELSGIGGHISTYASLAVLLEVAFNHFLRGKEADGNGDIVYFQGHAAPGLYARAYLEGRISEKQLNGFRRELSFPDGLSSYPHPWLMPDFWEFPTVSMGLSPLMAIYQARFSKYLKNRGLKDSGPRKVWAFLGDGEMDEPESMGAITLASRERLDNLIFVINCNLQRLDGPVRGNGQIIQELEAAFSGAGWYVLKVVWGGEWDPLFAKDTEGILVKHLDGLLDGQAQKYAASGGDFIRKDFFARDPRLLELVKNLSDEQLSKMRRGGHDPEKVYAAYKAAVEHIGGPTVILAQTIKGYGLGEAGEGRNVTHQQKKLNEEELRKFRSRFGIPISDADIASAPFYRPSENGEEIRYLRERRQQLGGYLPHRVAHSTPIKVPSDGVFEEFYKGSDGRPVATTMAFVRMLAKLLQDREIGRSIVPIVPDEARTFGMEALFRQSGIYSPTGQHYEPVDKSNLLFYNEKIDGIILEEGITEAGAMSSFIAAGTSYATHGMTMIPFFVFYSIFGLQRIGDLVWAAGDARARGFMIGGTAGRTTLSGEGLQHQDGHTHAFAYAYPTLKAYDPAFAYEIAVIIQDGIHRMYEKNEDIFYYITVMNELYPMPPMPPGVKEGIIKGLYCYNKATIDSGIAPAHLFGSGTILREALKAQAILADRYGIAADVWSATSYKELYNDAIETDRWNMLHPDQPPRQAYVQSCFNGTDGLFVAASDYLKLLPCSIARWIPGRLIALGTDGFGRSDGREELRNFFEVDARYLTLATLYGLVQAGKIDAGLPARALRELGIDGSKVSPLVA